MAPPSRDVIARASAPRRVSRRSRARVVVCDVAPPPVAGRVRSIDRARRASNLDASMRRIYRSTRAGSIGARRRRSNDRKVNMFTRQAVAARSIDLTL
jgi:hypothetical protein